jgi:hypothetical protein
MKAIKRNKRQLSKGKQQKEKDHSTKTVVKRKRSIDPTTAST